MITMDLQGRALRGIARYRTSALHRRSQGCCRFTPSCSHYAQDALRQRSFPVAVLLVVWRLLRCTPLTPAGTHDPVGRSRRPGWRKVIGVLVLSAITGLMVSWTAAAAAAPRAAALPQQVGETTSGDCSLFVGGRPFGTLGKSNPLQVSEGQRIVVTGKGPDSSARRPDSEIKAATKITVVFIDGIGGASSDFIEYTTGRAFQKSVNVDSYLEYGSGIYRVDALSVAPGSWSCEATFYVELNGSPLIAAIGVAVGGIGAGGTLLATRNGKPDVPDDDGLYDPAIEPSTLDALQAKPPEPEADTVANTTANVGSGCLGVLLFFLGGGTPFDPPYDFPLAAVPVGGTRPGRVWVRGHAITGFFTGLLAGVGFALAGQQLGWYPLDVQTAIVLPLAIAVFASLRAWWGRAWKV